MLNEATGYTLWIRTAAIHTIEIVAYSGFQPATRLGSVVIREKHDRRIAVNEV